MAHMIGIECQDTEPGQTESHVFYCRSPLFVSRLLPSACFLLFLGKCSALVLATLMALFKDIELGNTNLRYNHHRHAFFGMCTRVI